MQDFITLWDNGINSPYSESDIPMSCFFILQSKRLPYAQHSSYLPGRGAYVQHVNLVLRGRLVNLRLMRFV